MRLEIEGRSYEALDFFTSEQSTPLKGDTIGSVGTIDITIPAPDDYVFGVREKWELSRQNIIRTPRVFAGSPATLASGLVEDVVVGDAPSGRDKVLQITDVDLETSISVSLGNVPVEVAFSVDPNDDRTIVRPVIPVTPSLPVSVSLSYRAFNVQSSGLEIGLSVYRADGSIFGLGPVAIESPVEGVWSEVSATVQSFIRIDGGGVYNTSSGSFPPGAAWFDLFVNAFGGSVDPVVLQIDQVRIGYDDSTGVFDGWTEETN